MRRCAVAFTTHIVTKATDSDDRFRHILYVGSSSRYVTGSEMAVLTRQRAAQKKRKSPPPRELLSDLWTHPIAVVTFALWRGATSS